MCGITGFVTAGFGRDSRAVVHRMKAPPAYTLVVSPGATPQLARYWTSVRRRLGRDVPIGRFVSGGIDSGAVAARAARQTDAPPIQTFAVGFDAPSYDERRFARLVSDRFGTEHHEIVFAAADALSLMERVGRRSTNASSK